MNLHNINTKSSCDKNFLLIFAASNQLNAGKAASQRHKKRGAALPQKKHQRERQSVKELESVRQTASGYDKDPGVTALRWT